MEQAISFAATVCLETCRRQGRRLILGWTGATPGVCQGQASVKLLHELLEQLAVLRPATEGTLAELIDTLPAALLRDSLLIIVSTRPINLVEEAERSSRLAGSSSRSTAGPGDPAQCGTRRTGRVIPGRRIELPRHARAAVLVRRAAGPILKPGRSPPRCAGYRKQGTRIGKP